MTENGFWVRYWLIRGQSPKPTNETYMFYSYDDSYKDEDKKDEEMWEGEAQLWAENDGGCWSAQRYQYGFEFVEFPPIDWLESNKDYHRKMLKFYEEHLQEAKQ